MEQGHLCHVSTSLGPAQTALSRCHPALWEGPESFFESPSQPLKSRDLWSVDSVSPSALKFLEAPDTLQHPLGVSPCRLLWVTLDKILTPLF